MARRRGVFPLGREESKLVEVAMPPLQTETGTGTRNCNRPESRVSSLEHVVQLSFIVLLWLLMSWLASRQMGADWGRVVVVVVEMEMAEMEMEMEMGRRRANGDEKARIEWVRRGGG